MNITPKIKLYATKIVTPLTFHRLYDYNKLKTTNKIINQSQFLQEELSIRLSHRIFDLLKLPYGLPQNASINNVIDLYSDSFQRIQNIPKPTNEEQSIDFSLLLTDIKNKHSHLEENISRGIKSMTEYYDDNLIDYTLINNTLDTFFSSRVGIRTLISQNQYFLENKNIINNCNLTNIINHSIHDVLHTAQLVNYDDINIKLLNNENIIFPYIDSHLYYIITEVLKNAIISHQKNGINKNITIECSEGIQYITIKISDKGNGFPINHLNKIFSYSYLN